MSSTHLLISSSSPPTPTTAAAAAAMVYTGEELPSSSSEPLLPKSKSMKTFASVFIAIVGAGVLGVPYTFKRTGWLAGVLTVAAVAALTYHCMMLLVLARRRLLLSPSPPKLGSFGDLGAAVAGPAGKFAVDAMIVLSQAGFCVSYLIFIATTFANLFNAGVAAPILGIKAKTFYVWTFFPFQLGLNSIPTLTHLAPLSIFADLVDIGVLGVVMVEDVITFLEKAPTLQAFGGFSVVLYGVGVAVYAFEGIEMVLPLKSEAAEKEKFGKMLGLAMRFISLMHGMFVVLGYFAFGDETNGIITTNFGSGVLSGLVQMGLCINLFFTFPLMMKPRL